MSAPSPLHRLLRAVAPPFVRDGWRAWREPRLYRGDYANWNDAVAASRGYDDPAILARVVAAARAARDGRVAFERDGVTFAEPENRWPVLGPLLAVAARRGGRLTVVDFGGGLGSLYFQHRAWFRGLTVQWRVVEQPEFVAAGVREFADGALAFFPNLASAAAAGPVDVVLLSSVLPYLPAPHALLAELAERAVPTVLIDRTGVVETGRDRLTVQRVPPSIYPASYPAWFLDRGKLERALGEAYRVADEWTCADRCDIAASFRGFRFERHP